MPIAKVEPLTTARSLRGPFDYRLPARMEGVGVGTVLRVPFGRRRILGVVVDLAERSELPPERLAEPIEALEAGAPPELVRLGLWVAREYSSTPSRGLSLVLPPGTGASGRKVKARRELWAQATPGGLAALRGDGRLGTRQKAVLEGLGDESLPASELAARCGADRAALRRLEDRGWIETRSVEKRRRPVDRMVGAKAVEVELNPEQRGAVERISRALDGEAGRELLLHGVTASGKTEVYLAAAQAALSRGRSVIVLVPEIGLTPQAVSRFRERLGDRVAVLHSALGAGERYDEWRRLRNGEADVCVGPRSAVFAPLVNPGLIVIDEEHDPSYKQEGDPSYDARRVARRRAADTGAVLVAGTATPRPESWRALPRLELPARADGGAMPAVEVVDMRDADPRGGPLGRPTLDALDEVRREQGKAIVLVNRRGFAPYVCCRSCGHHWACPNCDVSLVSHRSAQQLACHHCGHREQAPSSCPECGSVTLARAGAGTERVEELLAAKLDPLPVFRLDSDSAAKRGAHADILGRFDEAPAGVLVGTQMVAKGHDFPDVTLSVILDADATLRFPDFRAEERTFAMVVQLAGRSGRGPKGGSVIVQTLAPEAPSIVCAARHDSEGFLLEELARREALRYPPFSHLTAINLASSDERALDRAAGRVAALLREKVPAGTDVLGPAALFRLRGRQRRRLLLKAQKRGATVRAVHEAVEAVTVERVLRGVAIGVDVDPQ
jgi:primosomal protein N' (replication factor Y)